MRKAEGHQLHIDGEPHGPVFDDIRVAAGYAVENGFAQPDREGRIVLDASAEIKTTENKDAIRS